MNPGGPGFGLPWPAECIFRALELENRANNPKMMMTTAAARTGSVFGCPRLG